MSGACRLPLHSPLSSHCTDVESDISSTLLQKEASSVGSNNTSSSTIPKDSTVSPKSTEMSSACELPLYSSSSSHCTDIEPEISSTILPKQHSSVGSDYTSSVDMGKVSYTDPVAFRTRNMVRFTDSCV